MKYYPLSILCAIAIVILSLMNMNSVPTEILSISDKLLHSIAYGGWSLIILFEMVWNRKEISPLRILLPAVGLPTLFGGVMELLQGCLFSPRQGDWWDMVANIAGSLAVTGCFIFCSPWIKKRAKR